MATEANLSVIAELEERLYRHDPQALEELRAELDLDEGFHSADTTVYEQWVAEHGQTWVIALEWKLCEYEGGEPEAAVKLGPRGRISPLAERLTRAVSAQC